MQFLRVPPEKAAQALQERIVSELAAGKKVLWFVSGGSNIPLSVAIMAEIDEQLSRNLTVTLIDERYGQTGHKDSNEKQLFDAGFQRKHAHWIPVLNGSDIQQTTTQFTTSLQLAFAENQAIIAQLGMGPDGHVSGILPHSAAAAAQDLAAYYMGPDYQRITTTFVALRRIQAAYLFAYGDNKQSALLNLRNKTLPLADQPAQILKELPEAYVYNDQIE